MLRFIGFKCLLIFSLLCYLTVPVLSDCRDAVTFDKNFDYFPDKIFFSEGGPGFNLTYNNNYIQVTDLNSLETYVLYCTATQPVINVNVTVSSYIQVPVANVAVSDRSVISFLEILGEEKTSLKYVEDITTITSPCLQKYNNSYKNINYFNTSQVASFDVIFKNAVTPSQAGGKYVTISYNENTPALKKAEWIKFISLFFNKSAIANEAFNTISSNYLCHLNNLAQVPNQTKKLIAWVALETYNNFTIEYKSFYQNITLDAAAFISIPMMSSEELSINELQENIFGSYIVIDMSNLNAKDSTLDTWKQYFGYNQTPNLPRFLNEKLLFRTHKLLNPNGHDDWSESSPSRPDLILQDLIAIQYPSYQKDYIVRWFNNFAKTGDYVVLTADNCNDATFGLPKTDFGTCTPTTFPGDGKDSSGAQIINVGGTDNNGNNNNNDGNNNSEKSKVNPAVIIAVSLVGSLLLLGLGAWLLVVAKRKYRERFVELRDEPVVQMNSVKEVK